MKVKWQEKATKQLLKLKNNQAAARILKATKKLETFPETPNVKPLTNHQYAYRLRVGDYRILFNVKDEIQVVLIEEVSKRNERTY